MRMQRNHACIAALSLACALLAGGRAVVGAIAPPDADPADVAHPANTPFALLPGALAAGRFGPTPAMHGLLAGQTPAVELIVDEALVRLAIQEQVARHVTSHLVAAGRQASYRGLGGRIAMDVAADRAAVAGAGYAGVLELAVVSARMAPKKGAPPAVALEIRLRTRATALAGGEECSLHRVDYRSRPRPAEEWTADQGLLLAEEFEHAYESLGDYVMEACFGPVPSSH